MYPALRAAVIPSIDEVQPSRQMGLCYESLDHKNMASKAYEEAWFALLEQRKRDMGRDAGKIDQLGDNHFRDTVMRELDEAPSGLEDNCVSGVEAG